MTIAKQPKNFSFAQLNFIKILLIFIDKYFVQKGPGNPA